MESDAEEKFKTHCRGVGDFLRSRYRELRKCATPEAMDAIWGDILVHRLVLQDKCERLIHTQPAFANKAGVDKYLWHLAYYDTIVECRKRLRLYTPLHNLSHTSSISGSTESVSFEGSQVRSSRSPSVSEGVLEEWQREWWSITLQTLFKEALGFFQGLFSQIVQSLDMTSLGYALDIINQPQTAPMSAAFWIARRVYMYVGDLYRYQYMYLPLLTYSDIGMVDTQSIHDLARWTYARARALFVDSGRVCTQLALLSAYAQNRFESVFWQMCSLCYNDKLAQRRKGGLLRAPATSGDSDTEDPIESSVVELVQAVLRGRENAEVFKLYHDVLAVLEEDLEDIRNNIDELDVASDYWAREYQLSAILAALLTASTLVDSGTKVSVCIQHLAVVLLLRQTVLLQQILQMQNGSSTGTVYLVSSVALWTDVWRSNEYYIQECANDELQWADMSTHMAELFDGLVRVVQTRSDCQLAQTTPRMEDLANKVLPHDVALLGWVSLRSVQQKLQYQTVAGDFHDISNDRLRSQLLQSSEPESLDTALLGAWHDLQNVTQIVCARIQALVLEVADRRVLPFLSWDSDGALRVKLPRSLVAAPLESKPDIHQGPEPVNLPLRIPDADTWHSQLPVLQKLRSTCTLILANAIHSMLIEESPHDKSILQLVGNTDQQTASIIVQSAKDSVQWSDANEYLFGLQADEMASIDEDELPTADEVPDNMRELLQCALHIAYVKCPGCDVAIITDNEELAFYASWFDISCVSSVDAE
ncbi:hypothetical protein GGF49_002613 [Coemansia sp. RSA 1853]|nr:hypothetical protein LPJ76_005360 [Coemansia sp. RSA 638]KAJ2542733.1 hypothetical protein GGF49_002613 [Coemansia sp. RSA 1853]